MQEQMFALACTFSFLYAIIALYLFGQIIMSQLDFGGRNAI